MRRAASTYAAFGDDTVTPEHVYTVAPMALAHRIKRQPLQHVARTVHEALATVKKRHAHP